MTRDPSQGGGGAGFSPAAGWTYSGTPGLDQEFTITNLSGGLGATLPTLALYDDMRGGTAGNNVPDGAGVMGSGAWADIDRPGVKYASGGRSGLCYRWLNNTTVGNYTFKAIEFAATTGVYLQIAANSRGWNLKTGATASFFKMFWFLHNQITNGACEICLPTMVDAATGATYFTGNDSDLSGGTSGPLPQWALDDQWPTIWDPNGWNSLEVGYVGGANPVVNAGRMFYIVTNANGRFAAINTARVLFNSASGYTDANAINIPAFIQNVTGSLTFDFDDVFCQIHSLADRRFVLTDAASIIASTQVYPVSARTWADGSVTLTPRVATLNKHLHYYASGISSTYVGACLQ
jgi:hypothetical protein